MENLPPKQKNPNPNWWRNKKAKKKENEKAETADGIKQKEKKSTNNKLPIKPNEMSVQNPKNGNNQTASTVKQKEFEKSKVFIKPPRLEINNNNNKSSPKRKLQDSINNQTPQKKENDPISKQLKLETSTANPEGKPHQRHNNSNKNNSFYYKPQQGLAFPTNPQEVSSNWKNLLQKQEISPEKKTTSPSKSRSHRKHSKKSETKIPSAPEEPPDIWFDDVDESLLELDAIKLNSGMEIVDEEKDEADGDNVTSDNKSLLEQLTLAVSLDCEMVGGGINGEDSILARVSIVNQNGKCVYNKYSKPKERIKDFRTRVSGIRPSDLKNAEDFEIIQKEVSEILNGRILVGHAVNHDLKVLFLSHPRNNIRDTSRYKPFRKLVSGGTPSLKKLTELVLGVRIQEGEHDSIQDAQAAMRLYMLHKKEWETSLKIIYKQNMSKKYQLQKKSKEKKQQQ